MIGLIVIPSDSSFQIIFKTHITSQKRNMGDVEVKKITEFQFVIQPWSRKILNFHRKCEMEKPRTSVFSKIDKDQTDVFEKAKFSYGREI